MTCTAELHCAGPASRDCLRPHRLQAFVFTAARAFTCSPSCAARLPSAPPSLTLPPSARIATSHVQGVPLIHEQEDFGVSSIPRTQHHLEEDWGHWSGDLWGISHFQYTFDTLGPMSTLGPPRQFVRRPHADRRQEPLRLESFGVRSRNGDAKPDRPQSNCHYWSHEL